MANVNKVGPDMDLKEIASLLFPVGRGFIDFTNTDYSNWLGLKWERELVGLTPIGYNPDDKDFNEIGKTGGEKTHTLTTNEMPSHYHTMQSVWDNTPAGGDIFVYAYNYISEAGSNTSTTRSGGDEPHNNMQPYKVVAYWKRIG